MVLAVGDFIAIGNLAWQIYRQCVLVARGAPEEFQQLVKEVTLLSEYVRLLQAEASDANSVLVRAGEGRAEMVRQMMDSVEATLKELEKVVKKYEALANSKKGKGLRGRKFWDMFRWSVDASDVDALRNRVWLSGLMNGGFDCFILVMMALIVVF